MQAGLIIVYASSGRTASLVAKYRPKMPILTLVVPHLKSSALKWELQGRSLARQCLIMRGQALLCFTPSQGPYLCLLEAVLLWLSDLSSFGLDVKEHTCLLKQCSLILVVTRLCTIAAC